MPYCTNCGSPVKETDAFCGGCGAPQLAAAPSPALGSRGASLLCYIPVAGWIPSIVILASKRFQHDRQVRFHAFQGLYLFVAWLVVDWVVDPFFGAMPRPMPVPVAELLKAALIGVWIFMLVKTSRDEPVSLPLVGELAERSVSEQR